MTKYLLDILNQPKELIESLNHLMGERKNQLEQAATIINRADHIYLSGIGASWNAALAASHFFQIAGRPVSLIEASELLHFSRLAPRSVVIIISRSGRSIEIVKLLQKASESGAKVIGITNTLDSPLFRSSVVKISVNASFDHTVSVTMYSALAMAAGLVASMAVDSFDLNLQSALAQSLLSVEERMNDWLHAVEKSNWLMPGAHYYFLARGASLASCHGAKLLWEEAAKSPASAMGTGNFRHGSQEIVTSGLRFGIWLDQHLLREEDLTLAADLRDLGACVMLVGENLPTDLAQLTLQTPAAPRGWQFLLDIMPVQLAAERFSHLCGVDCDSFRLCTYIVEKEGGIIQGDGDSVSAEVTLGEGTSTIQRKRNN